MRHPRSELHEPTKSRESILLTGGEEQEIKTHLTAVDEAAFT
jgi:hypothetical protein